MDPRSIGERIRGTTLLQIPSVLTPKSQKYSSSWGDCSYHIQTNLILEEVLFEALAYIVYIRERFLFLFLLVCTSNKVIEDFKLNVDE